MYHVVGHTCAFGFAQRVYGSHVGQLACSDVVEMVVENQVVGGGAH